MRPRKDNRSWLFQFAIQTLKYFLLSVFCYCVAWLLAALFDREEVLMALFAMGEWVLRSGAFVFCLLAIAVVVESLRS